MVNSKQQIFSLVIVIALLLVWSTVAVPDGQQKSAGCSKEYSSSPPPFPFTVGDGNDYGQRRLELTVPSKCQCDSNECSPCAIVIGYHGYSETGTSNYSWKSRLEPKGEAVGFISLYPTGDLTESNYMNWGALKKRRSRLRQNWSVPSCQDPEDGCLLMDGIPCDWCGSNTEDDAISTQREIDFTRAIIEWTMENYCVDPDQIFGTGFSIGGLLAHHLARHPDTSGLFSALLPVGGVDQAGRKDHLKWIGTPQNGDSPWILHANEIFDRFEPYDGRAYTEFAGNAGGGWNPVWLYPPVLQIFAKYVEENDGYSDCAFGPTDVGDRFGVLDVGGVVPEGYRRISDLEGDDQERFHCFTKDAEAKICRKLAICLWDGGERGDDRVSLGAGATHVRSGREWIGGVDIGTGGTEPMDIMWRFFQWSVSN